MASMWEVLEINETTDKDEIKAAYRRKLVRTNPEDYPEEFKALRAAYEQALAWAGKPHSAAIIAETDFLKKNTGSVSLWMERVTELYEDFYSRIKTQYWEEVLADDVCVGLDTAQEARCQLIHFLMEHMKLPNAVWKCIDQTFDITADRGELCEEFPESYVDYMIRLIQYESFLDYGLFEGPLDGDYDGYIDAYYDMRQAVVQKDKDKVCQCFEALTASEIYHPFIYVEKALILIEAGDFTEAHALLAPLAQRYPDNAYISSTWAEICLALGDAGTAKTVYVHLLEVNEGNSEARLGLAKCMCAEADYFEAKDQILNFLEENPGDNRADSVLKEVNRHLMETYTAKLEENPEDLGTLLDYGWCLCQNEGYEKCLKMLESCVPDEAHLYDYVNLRGRVYLCMERYEEALPWLLQWRELIVGLEDDGTKEYEKRKKRLSYADYAIACAYISLGELNHEDYYTKAMTYVEAAIAEEKEFRQRMNCMYAKADLLHRLGEQESCIDLCERIIAEESGYFPAYVLSQEAYKSLRMAQQVIDGYYRAVHIYPYNPKPYELAAEVFLNLGENKQAKAVLDQAEAAGVMSDELQLQRLQYMKNTAQNRGECLEAVQYCDEILALKGQTHTKDWLSKMKRQKAICYLNCGEFHEAMAAITEALYDNPADNLNLMVKATILENMLEDDQALKIYEMLLPKMPEHPYIYERLGRIYALRNEPGKALEAFKKVARINENYPYIFRMIGLMCKSLVSDGDLSFAPMGAEAFSRQIAEDGTLEDYMHRGDLYLAMGDYRSAKDDYERVIFEEPDCEDIFPGLAEVYYHERDYGRALKYYIKIREKGIRENGKRQNTLKTKFYLHAGSCCEHMNDVAQAAMFYREGAKKTGGRDAAFFLYRLCALYTVCGDKDSAKLWWRHMIYESKSSVGVCLGHISAGKYSLYMEGSVLKANLSLTKALNAAVKCGDRECIWLARYYLGAVDRFRQKGSVSHFRWILKESISELEAVGRDYWKLPHGMLEVLACAAAWLGDQETLENIGRHLKKNTEAEGECTDPMLCRAYGILAYVQGDLKKAKDLLELAKAENFSDVECEELLRRINDMR